MQPFSNLTRIPLPEEPLSNLAGLSEPQLSYLARTLSQRATGCESIAARYDEDSNDPGEYWSRRYWLQRASVALEQVRQIEQELASGRQTRAS